MSKRALACRRDLLTTRTRTGRDLDQVFQSFRVTGEGVLNTDETRVVALFYEVVEANVPVQSATSAGILGAAAADAFC